MPSADQSRCAGTSYRQAAEGELSVSTKYHKRFPLDEIPEIAIEKDENGGYVQISVSDNGSGIPETVRLHIFEPFVGTKGEGHQGIGLSVVYNTVNALVQ